MAKDHTQWWIKATEIHSHRVEEPRGPKLGRWQNCEGESVPGLPPSTGEFPGTLGVP